MINQKNRPIVSKINILDIPRDDTKQQYATASDIYKSIKDQSLDIRTKKYIFIGRANRYYRQQNG